MTHLARISPELVPPHPRAGQISACGPKFPQKSSNRAAALSLSEGRAPIFDAYALPQVSACRCFHHADIAGDFARAAFPSSPPSAYPHRGAGWLCFDGGLQPRSGGKGPFANSGLGEAGRDILLLLAGQLHRRPLRGEGEPDHLHGEKGPRRRHRHARHHRGQAGGKYSYSTI